MKKLFQFAYGWPVLIAALAFGFGGAALSAMFKNHWWFIIGFAIDIILVVGFIATAEDDSEPSPVMAELTASSPTASSSAAAATSSEPSSSSGGDPVA